MKRKKMKRIIFCCLAGVLLIGLTVGLVLHFLPKETTTQQGIRFHLANYDENIFENKAYLTFQRNLRYSAFGVEQIFSYENDYDSADVECKFFLDYFNTVIHGEYHKLKDFFVEDYFESDPKFTMQMIYEPYVLYHSVSEDEINGEKVSLVNFHVEYKIFKNNGTYRNDIPSNTSVPQIYQLIKNKNGEYRIARILDVVNDEN